MGSVVVVAVFMGVLAVPATTFAARPARRLRLTGEQFSATVDGSSYFVPGACYSGGPATSSFSFSGQATGPYPGPYTETGTISYSLTPSSTAGGLIASGPITGFSATFTITSSAGVVRGTEHLESALRSEQEARCYESAGGTSFQTEGFAPAYAARLRTGHRTSPDRGRASTALFSGLALGGTVADSGESEALTSAAPRCHRADSRSTSRVRRSRRRRRDHPHRRAEGTRLTF